MAESFDARDKKSIPRERKLQNDQYDEAVDVSMSMDQGNNVKSPGKPVQRPKPAAKETSSIPDGAARTTSISNRPFDEALEVSQSGSDESFESQVSERKNYGVSVTKGPMQGAAQAGKAPSQIGTADRAAPAQMQKVNF